MKKYISPKFELLFIEVGDIFLSSSLNKAKVRRSITIDEKIWEKLPEAINVSRSAFFEEQARKQINFLDDIEEIELKLKSIENKKNNLNLEVDILTERKEKILKLREKNKNNFEVKQKAMNIIRTVVHNEGVITETRVKFIAKQNYLDPEILIEMALDENLKVIRN